MPADSIYSQKKQDDCNLPSTPPIDDLPELEGCIEDTFYPPVVDPPVLPPVPCVDDTIIQDPPVIVVKVECPCKAIVIVDPPFKKNDDDTDNFPEFTCLPEGDPGQIHSTIQLSGSTSPTASF
jgi:hypothetical protein